MEQLDIEQPNQFLDPATYMHPIITENAHVQSLKNVQMELHKMRVRIAELEYISKNLYRTITSQAKTTQLEETIADIALSESINLTLTLKKMESNWMRATEVLNS